MQREERPSENEAIHVTTRTVGTIFGIGGLETAVFGWVPGLTDLTRATSQEGG